MKNAKMIMCTVLPIAMLAGLFLSCASNEFREDPARKRAHELTREAYKKYWPRQEFDKVISTVTKAIESDPEYPLPYALRGAAYNAKKQPLNALPDLHMALSLSSDYTPAFISRGISYMQLKRYDMARKDFMAALELAPGNITSLVNMAQIYSVDDNMVMACRYLEKAVEMGFSDMQRLDSDPNFRKLRLSECYDELENEVFKLKEQPGM